MTGFYAKVIKDSISPAGVRLTSIEMRYCRMVHSELLTHRAFSRNSASSRAIPFIKHDVDNKPIDNCTWSHLKNDPFMPFFLGAEKKGMQAGEELEGEAREAAIALIAEMREFCMDRCLSLYNYGLHKSIINRYLEPWSYITVLVTATEWNNFFRLRIHPAAERHLAHLAQLVKTARDASVPTTLQYGQWHLPYIKDEAEQLEIEGAIHCPPHYSPAVISAARAARLSYLTHDGVRSFDADLALFNRLIDPRTEDDQPDDAIHASPLEHVAYPLVGANTRSGNFRGWEQFRKLFPKENVPD